MRTVAQAHPEGNTLIACSPSLSQAIDLAAWEADYHLAEAERHADAFEQHIDAFAAAVAQHRRLEAMMRVPEVIRR